MLIRASSSLPGRSACRAAAMSFVWLLLPALALARTPPPSARIPLETLDFPAIPTQMMASGASVATLHYADERHLLLTFTRRRLLPRIPEDPETDVDRNIDAVLLDLPSGKVLARTSWRVHDPGQYLWDLGDDTFLLRQRNTLTLFRPVARLAAGESFAQQPFLVSNRSIGSVLLSPEHDLLMLETLERSPYIPRERTPSPRTMAAAAAAAGAAGDQAAEPSADSRQPPVQIDFFRLHRTSGKGAPVVPARAGIVGARNMVLLPVDASGFLSVVDQGHAHWAFDYHRHAGKIDELSPFDSTCHPAPFFVSRSEFIAFGCRTGQDTRELGGFNLRGEEMWERTFSESFTAISLSAAPATGRFALSRLVTNSPVITDDMVPEQFVAQNVTVYQTESGRQIFSLNTTPLLRAAQNFTLSPTGEELAVLNNGAIEIYTLPPLTPGDRAGIRLAETLRPERSEETIRIGSPILPPVVPSADRAATHDSAAPPSSTGDASQSSGGGTELQTSAAAAPVKAVDEPAALPAAVHDSPPPETSLGDPQPQADGHRKPPTLYGPGEKSATSDANSKPR